MSLEEMIAGFRAIRREWATVKSEKGGRAAVAKLLRLIERAGMSLEAWFGFMGGSGPGKPPGELTGLDLREGFPRLATRIARRECRCRAYRCHRVPNYGLPPTGNPRASRSRPASTEATASDCLPDPAPGRAPEIAGPCPGGGVENRDGGGGGRGAGGGREGGAGDNDPRRREVSAEAGKAVACREHALEGMVHLGSR